MELLDRFLKKQRWLPITPNPSAGSPVISFGIPEQASVGICIFDLSGRIVTEIGEVEYSPGYHDILLEGLYSGIYFCRITSGSFSATQRFVVVK